MALVTCAFSDPLAMMDPQAREEKFPPGSLLQGRQAQPPETPLLTINSKPSHYPIVARTCFFWSIKKFIFIFLHSRDYFPQVSKLRSACVADKIKLKIQVSVLRDCYQLLSKVNIVCLLGSHCFFMSPETPILLKNICNCLVMNRMLDCWIAGFLGEALGKVPQ